MDSLGIYSKLRPYQIEGRDSLRTSIRLGKTRPVLAVPTGGGKTEIAMAIIAGALDKGRRVAFLVNRVQLVNQASRRFEKSGIRHGIVQSDNTRDVHAPVVICSIQTVAKRGMPEVDVLIIDEAHSVPGSKAYRKVIAENAGKPIIGLSATPWAKGMGRIDNEIGGPVFHNLIAPVSIRQLIELGYLVDCEVYAPSRPDMNGAKLRTNAFGEKDYSDEDAAKAMSAPKLIGDIVEHWKRLSLDQPTVVFACTIRHSLAIVEAFRAAGVLAEHIDAYTPDEERAEILSRVESGQTKIISNVSVLAEGWDFPACRTMILARPTKSLVRYIQMVGRVLRPAEGKSKALLLDHSGSVFSLGFPTDVRVMSLDNGNPARANRSTKTEESVRACPSCGYVDQYKALLGGKGCVACGFVPARQPKDVEVGKGQLIQIRSAKATHAEKQSFYSGLLHIAQSRGRKLGWVAHTYKRKFGVWPKGMAETAAQPSPEVEGFVRHINIRYAKGKASGRREVAVGSAQAAQSR